MISIKIDDFVFLTKPNISILEACKLIGINIPRFCYHEILSVSGNCRMCLVEIENAEKPVASCVTEIENGMSILTNTPFVQKARENVVEALLLNHPLDCPICDQAGECDLQDQAKKFGGNYSRYFFKRKGVEDKYCGPLIRTVMTRCISCTRCVRYSSEIAGSDFYGTLNRGGSTEIGSYTPYFFDSEISGNVVDLCPVGALTSYPYASKARPWELRITESIDTTDSLNANIYVNFKETEVMRILPKANENLNDSLISDKARYTYDSNSYNRIISVIGPSNIDNSKKVKIGWKKFLQKFDSIIKSNNLNFHIDDKLDLESLVTLKQIQNRYPNKISIQSYYNNKNENFFNNVNLDLFHQIENVDSVLFLGTNPKIESSVLNAKIRIKAKNTLTNIYSFGLFFSYNFNAEFVNLNTKKIFNSLHAKNKLISSILANSEKPFFIIGNSIKDRISSLSALKNILTANFPNALVLFFGLKTNSETFHALNIKSNKSSNNAIDIFVKNDDVTQVRKAFKNNNNIKIWYNTHGSDLAKESNYILPATSHFEKEQTYINLEHRPQKTKKVLEISKGCKDFSSVLYSCFNSNEIKNSHLNYLYEQTHNCNKFDTLNKELNQKLVNNMQKIETKHRILKISKYPLFQKFKNFYLTDTFSRNSQIMKSCSNEIITNFSNFK